MKEKTDAPKVFISYCWSTKEHQQWVLELATKLVSDGVDVILDKWEIKEGDDKYVFMERMVNDPEVKKVLIISEKNYQEKANQREGGVGTESQIISEEIYNKVKQDKFVPIIREFNDNNEPCLPVYLKGRIYIDLSKDELFYEGYEKVLRNIFDKPLIRKPIIGVPPKHLFEDDQTIRKTSHKYEYFKNAIKNDKKHTNAACEEYLENFIEILKDFIIINGGE